MQYLSAALRSVLIGLILSYPDPSSAQDACQLTQDMHRGIVHEQPVSINTDVLWNTTFYPIPDHGVTVTNAPTSFHGITTFRWTELSPYTSTTRSPTLSSQAQVALTSPTPTAAFAESEFVLLVRGEKKNEKRQAGSVSTKAMNYLVEIAKDARSTCPHLVQQRTIALHRPSTPSRTESSLRPSMEPPTPIPQRPDYPMLNSRQRRYPVSSQHSFPSVAEEC